MNTAVRKTENAKIALRRVIREIILGGVPKWSLICTLRQVALEMTELPEGRELRALLEAETALDDVESDMKGDES